MIKPVSDGTAGLLATAVYQLADPKEKQDYSQRATQDGWQPELTSRDLNI